MLPAIVIKICQVAIALGLFNVWLVRPALASPYRGGEAKTLKEEFQAYGLNLTAFYVVGAVKLGCAVALIAGLWVPMVTRPAALILMGMMLGAVAMHVKVRDPFNKSLPALTLFSMSLLVYLR